MAEIIAWKSVEKLSLEARPEQRPRVRLMVGVAGAEKPSPPRVFICLEEDEARLLGIDLAQIPEQPVRVKVTLEVLE